MTAAVAAAVVAAAKDLLLIVIVVVVVAVLLLQRPLCQQAEKEEEEAYEDVVDCGGPEDFGPDPDEAYDRIGQLEQRISQQIASGGIASDGVS